MPLLGDAKNCLVGTQSIKKIMAGDKVVWGDTADVDDLKFYSGTTDSDFDLAYGKNLWASWRTPQRPSDCAVLN